MLGLTFFGDVDLASVAIWSFWVFFAGLVYYLQRENMREGYPLEDETGVAREKKAGVFGLPSDKTFHLPHGRGELTVPSGQRPDRDDLALRRTEGGAGSPYVPTGDPMVDGVGPAAWANRRDVPELDGHGHNKIRPMSSLPDFEVSAGRDPRGLAVVAGDGEVVGRVKDVWIDVPEQMVRFLTIDLNPEGTGKERLAPIHMVKVKSDRVVVRSLNSRQFEGIPTPKSEGEVTLLEEEKVFAWYAGGTLYHGDAEGEGGPAARDAAPARDDEARPDAIVSRPTVTTSRPEAVPTQPAADPTRAEADRTQGEAASAQPTDAPARPMAEPPRADADPTRPETDPDPNPDADPDRPFPDPADPVRKP